jgi:HAD superfamily hydrolase (TIGR01509 family)
MLTVLIVSGGGFQGVGILSALRALEGVRAVVLDIYPDSPGRYLADAFHVVPPVAAGPAFEDALVRIADAEGAGLLLPSTAFELEALACAVPALRRRGVAVAVSPQALLRLACDKRILYPALTERGFPVLPLVDPRQPDAAFPLIGKPAAGWGSRGVVVAESAAHLAREWSARMGEDYVWQRRLDSCRELSVDFAIDFEGRASEPGLRLRVRTSAGYAVVTDTAESVEVARWTERFIDLAREMEGRGAFNLQFLEDAGGVYLSDVNPRFGTSAVHWRGTCRDPILHLCRSVDPSVSAPPRSAPPRTVRVLGEMSVDDAMSRGEMGLQALVFDLDDTLVPHKQWILAKLDRLWDEQRSVLPEKAAFLAEALRIVEEGPRNTLFDQMGARFGWPETLTARLIDAYREVAPTRCALYRDVLPALATLRAKRYRVGLLTDNPPASQRPKIDAAGLAPWFEKVVFSREAGADKPDGAAFAAMAAALGLPPSAVAMVGDNPYRDGLGALAAGYGAAYIVVRTGAFFNFDPDLVGALPDGQRLRFVSSLREVGARLSGTAG